MEFEHLAFSICGILTNENSKFIFSFETRE
jgi:hypothetical protein